MQKNSLFSLFLLVVLALHGQECTSISYPQNGAMDIPVDATITWPTVTGINGYLISLGRTPGGTEILNSSPIGVTNSYKAPLGLPENTQIYVSISLVLFDGPPIACNTETFKTLDVITPPPCTFLIAPDNNAANVTIVTDITWEYAPTATGYRLSIGTLPGNYDILNNFDIGNELNYDPPEDLPQGVQIYILIIPTNENGDMGSCTEEKFSTGGESFDCDPIIDTITGETIFLRPQIDFPNQIGLCSSELPYTITTNDNADGYRWYKTNEGNSETLLSEGRNALILSPGRYRYEAYNTITKNGGTIECSDFKLFFVTISELAIINSIDVVNLTTGKEITIRATGIGDYEFALDDIEGPYQDSPLFSNIPIGNHKAYVRDKNGCGIAEKMVDRDLNLEDFPNFFTPNGDGINDFWQFVPPRENFEINIETISIFDRYGNLLERIDTNSNGWDGNFKGSPLPSSDYWFNAVTFDKTEIKGHFALKR